MALRSLRVEGNRLFCDGDELVEWSCIFPYSPAHLHAIRCIGRSPRGDRIISADQAGCLKIWDLNKPKLGRRVWLCEGYKLATAVGINDAGDVIAVACGIVVTFYQPFGGYGVLRLENVTVPIGEKVTSLNFTDEGHLICENGAERLVVE